MLLLGWIARLASTSQYYTDSQNYGSQYVFINFVLSLSIAATIFSAVRIVFFRIESNSCRWSQKSPLISTC